MVISDYFRIFDNMEEGVKGYFELLQIPRYQNLKGITEPGRYLETIWADGYATSSVYVQKNMELISQMTLEEKASLCSGLDFWHTKGVERVIEEEVVVSRETVEQN